MLLTNLFYYFSTTGKEGGLFSVDFKFLPGDGGDQSKMPLDTLKKEIQDDLNLFEQLLDQMLLKERKFKGKKEPAFTDSPGLTSGGYKYGGTISTSKNPLIADASVSADLECNFHKNSSSQRTDISMKIQLRHELNIEVMEATLAVPGLAVHPEAQVTIDRLRQLTTSVAADSDLSKLIDISTAE